MVVPCDSVPGRLGPCRGFAQARVDELHLCFYCARLYLSLREAFTDSQGGPDAALEDDDDVQELSGGCFRWPGIKN